MSKPVQLIVDGIYLPHTGRDRYQCYPAELGESLPMEFQGGWCGRFGAWCR